MGKTHDDDEVEIDLRELYYALKKRVLVILAAVLAGAVIAGAATKLLMTPVTAQHLQCLFSQRKQHFLHWLICRSVVS